jgi:hypothetical protein
MAEKRNVFTKSDDFKSEYSCAVVRVGELTPIEGSDFLARTDIFGTQIVVRKDQVKTGDLMIYAANETQLNERFLSVNNLFEIGERDRNANAAEVNAIMAEYDPIKKQADDLKNKAKNVKASMEQMKKKSDKFGKDVKKKQKELDDLIAKKTEEETNPTEFHDKNIADFTAAIDAAKAEIDEKQNLSDDCLKRAMEKTTVYTNLRKQADDLIASGKHIVDDAKKLCGFFNKYGRVRCLTLKGCPSFGVLFAPADLQKFDESVTVEEIEAYEGNEFDTVNGELFVKVFVPPMPVVQGRKGNRNAKAQKRLEQFDRMIPGEFSFHYSCSQFQKTLQFYRPEDIVDISKKIHGTSTIAAKIHVKNKRSPFWLLHGWNKVVKALHLPKKLSVIDYDVEFGPVYASRTVIKNQYINSEVGSGYYKQDVWSEYGELIYPYLAEGMTIYGEIYGFLTGSESPIQKTYDYGCEIGENKLMIYRISTAELDELGNEIHREWEIPEVLEWTKNLIQRMQDANDDNWKRIHPIDLLYHGTLEDLYPDLDTENHWHENLLERMKNDERFDMEKNEPLCKNQVPCEGIVIRKYGDTVLRADKLKCAAFLIGEALRVESNDFQDVEMMQGYGDDSGSAESEA